MQVVLDTNVLISGIYFFGIPHEILDAWRQGRFAIVASPEILDEYRRVAEDLQSYHPGIDARPMLALLVHESCLTHPSPLPTRVCDDPSDDKFLACAISSGSPVVISGDKALLRASGYRGVQVVTPRVFMIRFLKR